MIERASWGPLVGLSKVALVVHGNIKSMTNQRAMLSVHGWFAKFRFIDHESLNMTRVSIMFDQKFMLGLLWFTSSFITIFIPSANTSTSHNGI